MNKTNNHSYHNKDDSTVTILETLSREATKKIQEYIVGNQDLIQLILVALLSNGHILIEGVPGTAKTTIAKSIALITGCDFRRIQGAVDIQPADIIGVRTYDIVSRDFVLKPGPVFTNILLADELNRMNPKAQSAFIESMSERQATIDGETIPLPDPFIVIATQNPYEMEGTFPMIEVQRDRFMFSMDTSHLDSEEELMVIRRASDGKLNWKNYADSISPIIEKETLIQLIKKISDIHIEDPILQYIRDIIIKTRNHPDIALGASSRASISFISGVKSLAALQGREYVIPDDVKWIAQKVLKHRIYLTREAEIEGINPTEIIQEILESVEVQ
nr:MoxR family ATPase [uncultured Methanospirillum sp.]